MKNILKNAHNFAALRKPNKTGTLRPEQQACFIWDRKSFIIGAMIFGVVEPAWVHEQLEQLIFCHVAWTQSQLIGTAEDIEKLKGLNHGIIRSKWKRGVGGEIVFDCF